ncbi:MAG: HAD family phosphatase [Erysipelotrichaceae bacterium]|nr:HAD family phosphatase [Erysipelotrichaceae bacterium]
MYKVIVCDLDDTLIRSDKTISTKDIETITKAKNKGIKFVPATGRGFFQINDILKSLNLYDEPNEYVISFNGGVISENKNNRIIHFEGIPFEKARELLSRGLDYDVCIHVYTMENVYLFRFNDIERGFLTNMDNKIVMSDNTIDFLKGKEFVKALYMNQDRNYLQRIEKDLSDVLFDMDVSYSSNRYIEFNHKGVNKGEGLHKLAEILKVDVKEIIAIGDNLNDLSMIKEAGLGIGVKNTVPDMIEYCDFITEATHNESAVSEVIEKFIFNN